MRTEPKKMPGGVRITIELRISPEQHREQAPGLFLRTTSTAAKRSR